MPTYEYQCRKCGHQFEKFQSISANPLKSCPKCKGRVARMLTTGSGIIFKGSGFYQTDYKKSSHAPHTSEKSEGKKPESAKPDSKPDKPAK
jgi:putative FmdB family regulatory protein